MILDLHCLLPQRFLPAFVVLNKNADDQPEPSRGSDEKAEYGQTGITEDAKGGLHLHQERRSHHERGQDDPSRDAVGNFLKSFHHQLRVDGFDFDFQLMVGERIHDLVEPKWQADGEILHFQKRTQRAPLGGLLFH